MSVVVAEGEVRVTADGTRIPGMIAGGMRATGGPIMGAAGIDLGKGFLGGLGTVFGGSLLANVTYGAGQAIGQGIQAGIQYGIDAVGLASNLGESLNAVQVTFGEDVAKQLQVLAQEAPKSLRITQNAFNEYATRFAGFGRQIVGDTGDIVGWMDELTTRGADFASVYNIDVADALQLFQSGLAGETEPLRRYAVDLSAATVEAYALSSGINDGTHELTEQEKIQARYGLLLQQTSATMGDAANTADSYANQQRALNVAWEEAQTKLGGFLLGPATSLVTMANESILPALGNVIDRIGPKLGEALEGAGPKIEALGEKVAPLVEDFLMWAGEEGVDKVIGLMDELADAAPGWAAAFDFLTDPEAQPAAFLNWFVGDFPKGIRQGFFNWRDAMNAEAEPMNAAVNEWLETNVFQPFRNTWGIGDEGADHWARGTIEGMEEWAAPVNEGVNTWLDENVWQPFLRTWGIGEKGGADTAQGFGAGIDSNATAAYGGAARMRGGVTDIINGANPEAYGIGLEIPRGVARGIYDGKSSAIEAAGSMAADALYRAKNVLGIASPSKEGAWIGEMFDLGVAGGIRDNVRHIRDAVGMALPGRSSYGPQGLDVAASSYAAGTAAGTGTVIHIDHLELDVSKVRSLSDLVAILESIQQVARAGRGREG